MRCAARWMWRSAMAMLVCTPAIVSASDLLINDFDDPAELWRYDYGSPITPAISLNAAEGSPGNAPGAMQLAMSFVASVGGNNLFAFTNDAFFPATDLSSYDALLFDLKIVDGAALDAFGNHGFLQFASRETDNYNFNSVLNTNLEPPTGDWRTYTLPADTFTATRAFTLQLYGGPSQDIDGPITLLIDNVRLVVPEPSAALLVLSAASTLAMRRRR